jgi:hypothetical protein
MGLLNCRHKDRVEPINDQSMADLNPLRRNTTIQSDTSLNFVPKALMSENFYNLPDDFNSFSEVSSFLESTTIENEEPLVSRAERTDPPDHLSADFLDMNHKMGELSNTLKQSIRLSRDASRTLHATIELSSKAQMISNSKDSISVIKEAVVQEVMDISMKVPTATVTRIKSLPSLKEAED